jgi:phosphohistidine phosphatase
MKTLILARHAKSSWKHPQLTDHERPLNKRGRTDAPRMAAHLARNHPRPALIVTSTAERARITAETLAHAFGPGPGAPRQEPELYLATPGTLLAIARALDDQADSAMLVGHNPGMTDFINLLCEAGLDNLPTCGVARIGFDLLHWSAIEPGSGELLSLDVPKGLDDPQ